RLRQRARGPAGRLRAPGAAGAGKRRRGGKPGGQGRRAQVRDDLSLPDSQARGPGPLSMPGATAGLELQRGALVRRHRGRALPGHEGARAARQAALRAPGSGGAPLPSAGPPLRRLRAARLGGKRVLRPRHHARGRLRGRHHRARGGTLSREAGRAAAGRVPQPHRARVQPLRVRIRGGAGALRAQRRRGRAERLRGQALPGFPSRARRGRAGVSPLRLSDLRAAPGAASRRRSPAPGLPGHLPAPAVPHLLGAPGQRAPARSPRPSLPRAGGAAAGAAGPPARRAGRVPEARGFPGARPRGLCHFADPLRRPSRTGRGAGALLGADLAAPLRAPAVVQDAQVLQGSLRLRVPLCGAQGRVRPVRKRGKGAAGHHAHALAPGLGPRPPDRRGVFRQKGRRRRRRAPAHRAPGPAGARGRRRLGRGAR
ncbi:hypothetical protein H632_c3397p0, partial [Helicosporidium sp. ATCC 50920]